MKRFIALLLCFGLVFALCACGKEQTNEPEETFAGIADELMKISTDNL